jgi:FkbM family methyltransferase
MKIYNETNNLVNINKLEVEEQILVKKYIEKDDVVLELGARYGSVSCQINSKLSNKNNQVSVEPDKRVWEALEKNKKINNCEFNIINGFIGEKKMDLINLDDWYGGYGSTFIYNENTTIQSYTLDEIKKKYNLKFNVLVADCEGFLEVFFDENPNFYNDLRLIIFEADYPDKCNYEKIRESLIKHNFKAILSGHQNVYIKK